MQVFRQIPLWLRTLGLPILTFVAGGILSTIGQDFIQRRVLRSERWILLLISICLALIAALIASVLAETKELGIRLGIKTTYYELSGGEEGQANLVDAAATVVKAARETIYIAESDLLERWVDDEPHSVTPETNRAREAYYAALLDRAVRGRVIYERILQTIDGTPISQTAIGEAKLRHFYDMIEQRDGRHNDRIGLLTAPAHRLLTFVLVDNTYLLWQINEVLADGRRRMNGILIIEDASGQITRYFRDFFFSWKRNSQIASVQQSDLPVCYANVR